MIYNFLLVLYALGMAPKILWHVWRRGKKVPCLKDRFGLHAPRVRGDGKRIWIHAVSLGEIKAAQALIHQLHQSDASLKLLVTTATATGHEEACRSFAHAAMIRYLPLDFSWIMRRWVRSFSPDLIVFVEGDIWPNLLKEAHRSHTMTALVSGKISEKSAKRFRLFRKVADRIFGSLDLLCVQNEEHRDRFSSFVQRPIHISGNLKLDIPPTPIDPEAIRRRFGLAPEQMVLTISCTHAPEEKELLSALIPLWEKIPDLVFFLAPRHPERFQEIASLLRQMKIPFSRWSETLSSEAPLGSRRWGGEERLILVDAMGQLPHCYCVSRLAIVAGSFSSHNGGHNVVEPCLYGCPVLFGPSMHAQKELAKIASLSGVGKEVSEEMLAPTVLDWLESPAPMRANTLRFIEQNRGSAARTVEMLKKLFLLKKLGINDMSVLRS